MLLLGDSTELLATLPDNSIDSVVTDPPYGLSFMGKRWDYDVPSEAIWRECLRVLKPGGHLLAFAGTRTQHRMAVRIEDAGFEIRDMIAWVYGSGFPKSLDVSKAIDKAAGAERELVGMGAAHCEYLAKGEPCKGHGDDNGRYGETVHAGITAPATDAAREWQGWGTALKPALEPITVARKPLEGTVAANVLAHGTGGLNIDGCRVGTEDNLNGGRYSANKIGDDGNSYGRGINERSAFDYSQPSGRWPANLIHDGSEEVLAGFPQSKAGTETQPRGKGGIWSPSTGTPAGPQYGDSGSAARFFYCAKASKKDRDEGLDGFATRDVHRYGAGIGEGIDPDAPAQNKNFHPTVKPTDLMRYLCRLVTPSGGVVLDPFMGSGSTGKAARLEGFQFIGIERDAEYYAIAQRRIEAATIQERLAV